MRGIEVNNNPVIRFTEPVGHRGHEYSFAASANAADEIGLADWIAGFKCGKNIVCAFVTVDVFDWLFSESKGKWIIAFQG